MKNNNPKEFADAVEFDKNIRTISKDFNMKNYTHRSCKPLDEVEFIKEDNQLAADELTIKNSKSI